MTINYRKEQTKVTTYLSSNAMIFLGESIAIYIHVPCAILEKEWMGGGGGG